MNGFPQFPLGIPAQAYGTLSAFQGFGQQPQLANAPSQWGWQNMSPAMFQGNRQAPFAGAGAQVSPVAGLGLTSGWEPTGVLGSQFGVGHQFSQAPNAGGTCWWCGK